MASTAPDPRKGSGEVTLFPGNMRDLRQPSDRGSQPSSGWLGPGIAFGLTGGAADARLMGAFLFDLAPTDIVTHAGVTLILSVAAALACLVPAASAVQVDPASALRSE